MSEGGWVRRTGRAWPGFPRRRDFTSPLSMFGVRVGGWRKVMLLSQKDPEGWRFADKFTMVLESAALRATELSAYGRERGLEPGVSKPVEAGSPFRQQ